MYSIMHKNSIIAKADVNGITEIIIPDLCTACFAIGMPLEHWLTGRTLDTSHSHARMLLKALGIHRPIDTEKLIEAGHGVCITDNWWVQKEDEHLGYQCLREYNKELADIAFYGVAETRNANTSGYTELGTTGSFEKAWRYMDGTWYLHKAGRTEHLLSEYYAYAFLKAMDVPVADDLIHREYMSATGLEICHMITKDFTENARYDFEPFFNYYDDREEPEYILSRMDEKLHEAYIRMLFYDALLYNWDRHNLNAGFLRDSSTGKLIGLSPCFDYNLCLVAVGTPRIGKHVHRTIFEAEGMP